MNKKLIWVVVIFITIIVWGILANNPESTPSSPIKVAALLNLTGDAAAWGENAQKGIQLAVEQINKKGGINGRLIEVIYEDTAGDPKQAVSAFQAILARGDITAVIGPLTQTEDIAVGPLVEESGMPSVVPGYVPPQNRKNFYNPLTIWMDPETESHRLAQYVYDQGIRKVAIIGTLDSWEVTISDAFEKKFTSLGGTITHREIVQPSASEMKLPVTKTIASKPEAIFLGTYYQFINSLKSLSDQGFRGKLYSIEVDNYLAGETAVWSDELRFIAPDYYSSDFITQYKDFNGTEPGIPSGQAYDAANILFNFIEKSDKKSDIIEQMKSFASYDGVSGKLEITGDHRAILPTAIFEIKKGKIKRINEIK